MGGFSLWHWLVVGVIVLLLFGKGRFSDMMGDVAKGIKSFKKGITEEDEAETPAAQRRIAETPPAPVRPVTDDRPVGDTLEARPIDPAPSAARPDGERREP